MTLDGSSSSVEITDLDTEGVYQFALTCSGTIGGSAAAVAEVTVESATCAAPSLYAGLNTSWYSFWGEEFPDSGTQAVSQPINTGQYVSIQFDTALVSNNGRVFTIDNVFTSATRLGTISKCPGRFEAPPECTHTWVAGQGDTGAIDWTTDGKVGACALMPNTTYFLNITFTDGVDSNTDSCTTLDCIATVQHDLAPTDP